MALPSAYQILEILNETDFTNKGEYVARFQTILSLLKNILIEIEQNKNIFKANNRFSLCASQFSKTLPPLINVVKNGIKPSQKRVVGHLLEKVKWCVTELLSHICDSSTSSGDTSGIFVKSMDMAISMVNNEQFKDPEFKGLVDDLLCQALTIAKLSKANDHSDISSASKNVLTSMSNMEHSEDDSRHFCKESLLLSLEQLERHVNVAVLRLVLHTLSKPWAPAKAVVMQCMKSPRKPSRKMSDLDEYISCLDLHSDRIHLIGNFAIACSENKKAILEVQSCLASLEFTDNALVPAITSFYLDTDSLEKREFLKFLIESWQKQLMDFSIQLDSIIDSLAFSEVVLEDLLDLMEKFKETIMDKTYDVLFLEFFLQRGRKLVDHIRRAPDRKIQEDARIKEALRELKYSLNTFQMMIKKKLHPFTIPPLLRQMEKAVNIVNKLTRILSDIFAEESPPINKTCDSSSLDYPDSVKDLPLDISDSSGTDSSSVTGRSWLKTKFFSEAKNRGNSHDKEEEDASPLKPYLERATVLRSTFYGKTPSRSAKMSETNFEVSDILDNLTGLPENFTILETTDLCSGEKESREGSDKSKDFKNQEVLQSSTTMVNSDDMLSEFNSDILNANTLQRVKDLKLVEKKINFLKFKCD